MIKFEIIGETNPIRGRLETKIKDYLDNLPYGKLLTTHALASAIKYSPNSIRCAYGHSSLKPYKYYIPGDKNLWGNTKTIKEFIKHEQK